MNFYKLSVRLCLQLYAMLLWILGPTCCFRLLRIILRNGHRMYSNSITASRHIAIIGALSLLTIELLCNMGANCFIVNDPTYLHNLVPTNDTVGITGGESTRVDYKGTLYIYLEPIYSDNDTALLIQVDDVPCIKLNPHSGFPLTPFVAFGFKQVAYFICNKIFLQDATGLKYDINITSHKNRLDYVNVKIIHPDSPIPSSFNLVKVNHSLEAHEKFLHACPAILYATSTSNEITNMPFVPSTCYDCPICLQNKMKKMQPASSKQKQIERKLIPLAHTTIKKLTLRMPSKTISPSLGLPIPDTVYPPGALIHIDFSFYDVISIQPMPLYQDNTAVIALVKANKIINRLRHINILLCYMHNEYNLQTFTIGYCQSNAILSNFLIKPLSSTALMRETSFAMGYIHLSTITADYFKRLMARSNISTIQHYLPKALVKSSTGSNVI